MHRKAPPKQGSTLVNPFGEATTKIHSNKRIAYDRDFVIKVQVFRYFLDFFLGKSNTTLYSASNFRAASNDLPPLLLKPLITAVLPLVSKSAICLSVSSFSLRLRKTIRPQSALLHLATFG